VRLSKEGARRPPTSRLRRAPLSERSRNASADPLAGTRRFIVPADIVAVPRRSPPRVKKRTPWHPRPDGEIETARSGDREWFSDRLFVERYDDRAPAGYGMSALVHAALAVSATLLLVVRPEPVSVHRLEHKLFMPAAVAPLPHIDRTPPRPGETPRPASAPPQPVAAPPKLSARAADDVNPAAAPIEAPSSITPETGAEQAPPRGVEGGVSGGVVGGVVGGDPGGSAPAPAGPPVVRVGADMKPPRKIKDVQPVYPLGGLTGRTNGSVVIEATIGLDGKVQDAKVLRSVPALDRAALDAVRQWE
jgi:protein TonB